VAKQGAKTGTTSGYISALGEGAHHVKATAGMHKGDSGGLMYTSSDYGILAVALSNYFTGSGCPAPNSNGNSLEYVEQKYDLLL